MKKELYLINTTLQPEYGLAGLIHPKITRTLSKKLENKCDFSSPFLALFPDGKLQVPGLSNGLIPGGIMNYVVDGLVPSGSINYQDCSLEDYIFRLKEEGLMTPNGIKPITAVVEFSQEELYPREMELLAKKYEIKQISD